MLAFQTDFEGISGAGKARSASDRNTEGCEAFRGMGVLNSYDTINQSALKNQKNCSKILIKR